MSTVRWEGTTLAPLSELSAWQPSRFNSTSGAWSDVSLRSTLWEEPSEFDIIAVFFVLAITFCIDTDTVGLCIKGKDGSRKGQAALLVLDSAVPGDRLITNLGRVVCFRGAISENKKKIKSKRTELPERVTVDEVLKILCSRLVRTGGRQKRSEMSEQVQGSECSRKVLKCENDRSQHFLL